MNYPVLWNAIKVGLLVTLGLSAFLIMFSFFIAALITWGVPTGPAVVFTLMVVIGGLVGLQHYMDNA